MVSGFAVMGGAAALFFGAGSLVVLAATLSAGLLIAIGELLARWNIPPFYSQVLGGFVAVGGAVLVALIDQGADPSTVVISCIIVQLAGLSSISAVQDAVTGWYVTAAGRILEALMLTVGLVAGVRVGLLLADVIGADISVSASMPLSLTSVVVVIISGLGMGLGYGVGTQVPARLLLFGGAGRRRLRDPRAPAVQPGAGPHRRRRGGRPSSPAWCPTALADRLRAPSLAFVMAGVIPLVPGSLIYRGLLGLGDDLGAGVAELLRAGEIAISIAAGVVLGQLLASRLMPYFRRSGIAYTPAISSPFTTMRRRRLSLGSRRMGRRRGAPVIEPSTMTGEMTALSSTMFDDPSFLEDLDPSPRPRGHLGAAHRPRGVTMSTTALIAAGGYSRSGTGRGPGIELLKLSRQGAAQAPAVERLAVVDLPDPSFLLWSRDGSLLYAVLEGDPTRVVAVRVSADGEEAEIVGRHRRHGPRRLPPQLWNRPVHPGHRAVRCGVRRDRVAG